MNKRLILNLPKYYSKKNKKLLINYIPIPIPPTIEVSIAIRVYYSNKAEFYITGKQTYSKGSIGGTILSHHIIIIYRIGRWKIVLPLYLDTDKNNKMNPIMDRGGVEYDDNMIHFSKMEKLDPEKIKKMKKFKNKEAEIPSRTIVINTHQINYLKKNKLIRTVYWGTKQFNQKLAILKEQSKIAAEMNKNSKTEYWNNKIKDTEIELDNISENDYWYMYISKSNIGENKILNNDNKERAKNMHYLYKLMIIIKKILIIDSEKLIKQNLNFHKLQEKIEEICKKRIATIAIKMKNTLLNSKLTRHNRI